MCVWCVCVCVWCVCVCVCVWCVCVCVCDVCVCVWWVMWIQPPLPLSRLIAPFSFFHLFDCLVVWLIDWWIDWLMVGLMVYVLTMILWLTFLLSTLIGVCNKILHDHSCSPGNPHWSCSYILTLALVLMILHLSCSYNLSPPRSFFISQTSSPSVEKHCSSSEKLIMRNAEISTLVCNTNTLPTHHIISSYLHTLSYPHPLISSYPLISTPTHIHALSHSR